MKEKIEQRPLLCEQGIDCSLYLKIPGKIRNFNK